MSDLKKALRVSHKRYASLEAQWKAMPNNPKTETEYQEQRQVLKAMDREIDTQIDLVQRIGTAKGRLSHE